MCNHGCFTSFPLKSPFPIHSIVTLSLLSFSEVTMAWCVCPATVTQTNARRCKSLELLSSVKWSHYSEWDVLQTRSRVKFTITALDLHESTYDNLSEPWRHSPQPAGRPLRLKQLSFDKRVRHSVSNFKLWKQKRPRVTPQMSSTWRRLWSAGIFTDGSRFVRNSSGLLVHLKLSQFKVLLVSRSHKQLLLFKLLHYRHPRTQLTCKFLFYHLRSFTLKARSCTRI